MAVEDPPGVLDSDSTPSAVQRHTTQGLLGVPVGAFAGGVGATAGGGHGVVGSDHLAVSQTGGGAMSVDVSKGIAFIVGTVSAAQGPYSFYNDATVTLAIAAAHATLARRTLVIAQIQDATYSGAVRSARLTTVDGTPAASPADPSLAAFPNALVLARVTVPAAAGTILNANIADVRTIVGRVGCTLRRAANQSLTNAIQTAIAWDTEDVDNDGFHAPSDDDIIIPAGLGGIYSITTRMVSSVNWGSGGASDRFAIEIGGVLHYMPMGPSSQPNQTASVEMPIAAGTSVRILATQNSGGAANFTGAVYVYRVSP